MLKRQRIMRSKRGIETITAVLMLLLMFVFITALIGVFFNINLNSQAMNEIDHERSQEKIVLQEQIADEEIESVIITNEGSIEVKIMALYQIQDGVTTFLGDPNTDQTTFLPCQTYIAPANSTIIGFQTGYKPAKGDVIVATTQRGTKSLEKSQSTKPTETQPYQPSDLVLGPLLLRFKSFQYQETNGLIDPLIWKSGWEVPGGKKLAWKITITNVDEKKRDITISRYSGLTPVPNEFSTSDTWFLEPWPQNPESLTQPLPAGEDTEIIFMWSTPKGAFNTPQITYTGGGGRFCAIFLTFFGVYHEIDESGEETGELTSFAQTVPFQAVVMGK